MNKDTRQIDFNTFKEYPELIRYMDNDIAIIDNLTPMQLPLASRH